MLHKILTSCMLKSTQGMIVTFLVGMNKRIPPRIFFQLLSRFPLTCAKNPVYYYCCAGVAQLVEQLIRNQQVAGSSPATSSIKAKQYRCRRPEAYGINCSRAFSPRKFTDDSIDANHCFPLTGGTRTPICSEVGKIKTMWCPF